MQKMLRPRALRVIPLSEEQNCLGCRDLRHKRRQHPAHHVVESGMLEPPRVDLLVVIPLGRTTQGVAEQINLDVLSPEEAMSSLRHVDLT